MNDDIQEKTTDGSKIPVTAREFKKVAIFALVVVALLTVPYALTLCPFSLKDFLEYILNTLQAVCTIALGGL